MSTLYGSRVYQFADLIHGGEYVLCTFPCHNKATITKLGATWPARFVDRPTAAAIIRANRTSQRQRAVLNTNSAAAQGGPR